MDIKDWYCKKCDYDNGYMVKIIALIQNNQTGETREHKDYLHWGNFYQDDEPSAFIWEDGNYSCDCNRYLFFQRAKNEDEDSAECGDDKYSVNLINPKNNEIIYKEF